MKLVTRTFVGLVMFLMSCSVVYSQNIARNDAHKIFNQGVYRKLNARIMSIDLASNVMIVAEKNIKLPTFSDKKGRTQYLTQFIGSSGQAMRPNDFKVRDRVIVEGVKLPDGSVVASSIKKVK